MVKVLVIAGFLGAGKTTLIRHLLGSKYKIGEKIAILVNEVGKIGIDGALLAGMSVDVLELTSGCICCSIKTDFFRAVQEIHERFRPDFLIVEPTGVAQPEEILDILTRPPLNEACRIWNLVTLVDAGFFRAKDILGPFYHQQILGADILLLNKIDLVNEGLAREIKAELRRMNPRAKISLCQNCVIDPALLFQESYATPHRKVAVDVNGKDLELEGFQTFSFEDKRPMDEHRFREFIETLPPSLLRCKGWVRYPDKSVLFNYSGGNHQAEITPEFHDTALVLVGRKCPEMEILKSLKECVIQG